MQTPSDFSDRFPENPELEAIINDAANVRLTFLDLNECTQGLQFLHLSSAKFLQKIGLISDVRSKIMEAALISVSEQEMMIDSLAKNFSVLALANGEVALQLSKEKISETIIEDIVGEICSTAAGKHVSGHPEHIPVILQFAGVERDSPLFTSIRQRSEKNAAQCSLSIRLRAKFASDIIARVVRQD